MIAEAGDADYLWMLQVQEYAKEVGIPTSAVKLPTRRISLLSTANSLLRAVNIARVASGKEEVKRPATVASDEGPYEEPNGGDQQAPFATPEQIGSIEAYIDKWEAHGQDRLVDPDTEEVWVFEDTDLLLLSVDDADRMLICFREAEPALV